MELRNKGKMSIKSIGSNYNIDLQLHKGQSKPSHHHMMKPTTPTQSADTNPWPKRTHKKEGCRSEDLEGMAPCTDSTETTQKGENKTRNPRAGTSGFAVVWVAIADRFTTWYYGYIWLKKGGRAAARFSINNKVYIFVSDVFYSSKN